MYVCAEGDYFFVRALRRTNMCCCRFVGFLVPMRRRDCRVCFGHSTAFLKQESRSGAQVSSKKSPTGHAISNNGFNAVISVTIGICAGGHDRMDAFD